MESFKGETWLECIGVHHKDPKYGNNLGSPSQGFRSTPQVSQCLHNHLKNKVMMFKPRMCIRLVNKKSTRKEQAKGKVSEVVQSKRNTEKLPRIEEEVERGKKKKIVATTCQCKYRWNHCNINVGIEKKCQKLHLELNSTKKIRIKRRKASQKQV